MAFPQTLTAALSNNYISANIRSNAYPKILLMALLAGQTAMDTGTDQKVGRPGSQMIFSGAKLGDAKREQMRNMQAYAWGIQAVIPNTATTRGQYGTMPTNSTATTTANSQIRANAIVPWTDVTSSLNLVWCSDLDYAISGKDTAKGIGVAVTAVQENAAATAMQDLINKIAPQFWSGAPSTWSTNGMDQIAGIVNVCGTGVYANSTRVAGTALVSHTINATTGGGSDNSTAIANDPEELLFSINGPGAGILYTNGAAPDTVITDYTNYYRWKRLIQSRGQTVQVVNNLPQMGAIGLIKEALCVDGRSYLMWDTGCPANTAAFLTLKYWLFITHPNYNFSTTELVLWKKYAEGAKDCYGGYCELKPLLVCEAPCWQAYVTNLPQ